MGLEDFGWVGLLSFYTAMELPTSHLDAAHAAALNNPRKAKDAVLREAVAQALTCPHFFQAALSGMSQIFAHFTNFQEFLPIYGKCCSFIDFRGNYMILMKFNGF